MCSRCLLCLALLALAACDLFEKPPASDDVVGGDTAAACAPGDALLPFFVDVSRAGEADPTAALLAGGQAQVTYLGAATGTRADAGYVQELHLRFYDDARDVIVAVAMPPRAPALVAAVGETLEGVVVRRAAADGGDVYVALRDLQGTLRAWLARGASAGPSTDAGWACPYGLACPVATFADTACETTLDDCGARLWPPVELRPAGTGDPVTLGQGEVLAVTSGGATWTFLVAYASRFEGDLLCPDTPAAALALAVLFGAPVP